MAKYTGSITIGNVKALIKDYPGFPRPGVVFRDIMPLLTEPEVFEYAISEMTKPYKDSGINLVMSPGARGFLFGPRIAKELGCGFVPIRKQGKLPGEIVSKTYDLEYGQDIIEIQAGSIQQGQKVLFADDLLATGGTMDAAAKMVKGVGAEIAGFSFLIELSFLNGRDKLKKYNADVHSLIQYDSE